MSSKVIFFFSALAITASYAYPQAEIEEDEVVQEDEMSYFYDNGARVVGGSLANIADVPWVVALSSGTLLRSHFCGGSIISQRHVLTAAHCIAHVYSRRSLVSSLRGHVGAARWNSGTAFRFASNVSHPHYVSAQIKNDVGILITSANIVLGARVQTIALNFNYISGGAPAKIAGWGAVRAGGSLSRNLREVYVATIDGRLCEEEVARASAQLNIRAPPVESHIEICTYHSPGQGTCNGDSGSALVELTSKKQIGVVSWGFPCARGAPDMFVRVSAFEDFIKSVLN